MQPFAVGGRLLGSGVRAHDAVGGSQLVEDLVPCQRGLGLEVAHKAVVLGKPGDPADQSAVRAARSMTHRLWGEGFCRKLRRWLGHRSGQRPETR